MTPLTVFVRTLMKASAIFLGTTTSRARAACELRDLGDDASRAVTARQSPAESAIDGLVGSAEG